MTVVVWAVAIVASLMVIAMAFACLVTSLRLLPVKAGPSATRSSPTFGAGLPAPATAAARGQAIHRSFAAASGLWAAPDSPLEFPAGSPAGARELLVGVADALLMESASAAVRGDEATAKTLAWVEDFVRDACDAITD